MQNSDWEKTPNLKIDEYDQLPKIKPINFWWQIHIVKEIITINATKKTPHIHIIQTQRKDLRKNSQ